MSCRKGDNERLRSNIPEKSKARSTSSQSLMKPGTGSTIRKTKVGLELIDSAELSMLKNINKSILLTPGKLSRHEYEDDSEEEGTSNRIIKSAVSGRRTQKEEIKNERVRSKSAVTTRNEMKRLYVDDFFLANAKLREERQKKFKQRSSVNRSKSSANTSEDLLRGLVYDPDFDCYYDPKTDKYYKPKHVKHEENERTE